MGQAAGLLLAELLPDQRGELSQQARFVTVNWARGARGIRYDQGWPVTSQAGASHRRRLGLRSGLTAL